MFKTRKIAGMARFHFQWYTHRKLVQDSHLVRQLSLLLFENSYGRIFFWTELQIIVFTQSTALPQQVNFKWSFMCVLICLHFLWKIVTFQSESILEKKLCIVTLLSGDNSCKTGNQLLTFDNISRWFSSTQLQSVVLAAVADLQLAVEGRFFCFLFNICEVVSN